ncbi:uncharacterized protein LOC108649369 [Drosophila navojoa]|nr:uncharacterized protein LOC108649369 [Drosophila navojoa]
MAPFSICSQCKARTRKVTRDAHTLKQIYLCPTCFNAKADAKNIEKEKDPKQTNHKQQQPAQATTKQVAKPAIFVVRQSKAKPKAVKKPVAQFAHVAPPRVPQGGAPGNIPKHTPPLMEPVVINGRKYIAISATASGY